MLIGYARVSTQDQNLALQEDALKSAGCKEIFNDVLSGAKTERPGLSAVLKYAREGDVLAVWRLDRLGRSLADLLATVKGLEQRGIGFRSLTEGFDTTTPGGTLVFQIFGAMAEFERNLIRERTQAGLAAARARGKVSGRPRALNEKALRTAQALRANPTLTVKEICETLKISTATYYRHTALDPDAPERRGGGRPTSKTKSL